MLLVGPLGPLLRWPGRKEWQRALPIALAGAIGIGIVSALGGLASWQPQRFDASLLAAAAVLLVIPALGEELLFRWLLYPRTTLPKRRKLVVAAVALFVLWHPVQAWLDFGPAWSGIFLEPAFLLAVACAGVTLAALRDATGSLWPPVLFHWLLVCAWKFLGGGPF